jgi:hypothetical protein
MLVDEDLLVLIGIQAVFKSLQHVYNIFSLLDKNNYLSNFIFMVAFTRGAKDPADLPLH